VTQLAIDGCSYTSPFLLADVRFPILGIDFLRHFKLLVDMAANKLVPSEPPPVAVSSVEAPAAPSHGIEH
jgi:hypothetical protein